MVNRLNEIISNYLESDNWGDETTVEKLATFANDINQNEETYRSLLNIVCEDFNVHMDTTRLMDAIPVFTTPLDTIKRIIIETIKHNQPQIEDLLLNMYKSCPKDTYTGLSNLITILFNVSVEEGFEHHVLIKSALMPIISDVIADVEDFLNIYYPQDVTSPAIVYNESIISTLLRGVDGEEGEIIAELITDIEEDLFTNIENTWFKFKK